MPEKINLEKLAVAVGGVYVEATTPEAGRVSSLKASQFQSTMKALKKLGYMFPKDQLIYRALPASGSSYTFPFTNGMDNYGLNVIATDATTEVTAALLTSSGNRITEHVRYTPKGELDVGVASHIKDLMEKLNAKAQA